MLIYEYEPIKLEHVTIFDRIVVELFNGDKIRCKLLWIVWT